jgi:hypothetical protein
MDAAEGPVTCPSTTFNLAQGGQAAGSMASAVTTLRITIPMIGLGEGDKGSSTSAAKGRQEHQQTGREVAQEDLDNGRE